MKEKIANPLPVKEALELSKGSIIPIPIGDYSEVVPSCGGSDAPYFPDMILEPIEKFNATHFPDGRANPIFRNPYNKILAATHVE